RYAAAWLRPPTPAELQGLVDNYIREEILYREGVAMGLDRDDPVIQRRVVQKLDVLSEETSSLTPPTDTDLADYLQKHAKEYERPPVFDYQQVMFDPVRHGARLEAEFKAALAALNAGADPAELGDSSLLPAEGTAVPLDWLAREYGNDFAEAIQALPVGLWQGPVRSGFGVHIVRIGKRIEAQAASLAAVRAEVERDWENDRRKSTREAYYQGLLKTYEILIEAGLPQATPEPASADPAAAAEVNR
ncbi:MAG: peptidyl-prolyl cis-trans isomerase, partial [Lysobacterales bacterium]